MSTLVAELLLLLHALATLAMGGIIWFVQIVHYPLFSMVGQEAFVPYEHRHVQRTGLIVGPLMLTELFTACGLIAYPPTPSSVPAVWAGLTLLATIWICTFTVQVPLHTTLESGFDSEKQRKLVRTNWWRTWFWTARCGIVLWMFWEVMGQSGR